MLFDSLVHIIITVCYLFFLFYFNAATTMIDLGKDKRDIDEFAVAMDDALGEFEFPDEFVMDVWTSIETVRKRTQQS